MKKVMQPITFSFLLLGHYKSMCLNKSLNKCEQLKKYLLQKMFLKIKLIFERNAIIY